MSDSLSETGEQQEIACDITFAFLLLFSFLAIRLPIQLHYSFLTEANATSFTRHQIAI